MEWLLDVLGLEQERRHHELLELAATAYAVNGEKLTDTFYFIDYQVINIKLLQGQLTASDLVRFFANPIDSIDFLLPLFDKLIFYGYRDLVDEVVARCYKRIRDSVRLFPGTASEFAEAAFMLRFQQAYEDKKANRPVDIEEITDYLRSLDYNDTSGQVGEVLDGLFADLSNARFSEDKVASDEDMMCLSMLFSRYLYDQAGLNFQIGAIIWYAVLEMCPAMREPSWVPITFGELFSLDGEAFEDYIYGRLDLLSNKRVHAIGVLWGIPYFYDFALAQGLISRELHARVLDLVDRTKREIIRYEVKELWKWDFVHAWPPPPSVAPEDYAREGELFRRTFSEKVSREQLLAEGFISPQER